MSSDARVICSSSAALPSTRAAFFTSLSASSVRVMLRTIEPSSTAACKCVSLTNSTARARFLTLCHLANLGKRRAARPLVHHFEQARIVDAHKIVLVDRHTAVELQLQQLFHIVAHTLARRSERSGTSRLDIDFLLEHKARDERHRLGWRQVLKVVAENELGEHQLVARVDFARHTTLDQHRALLVQIRQQLQHTNATTHRTTR